MTKNRFRAVVEADYYDNDGNDKTIKLLLNNVAICSPATVGITDEILVNAIRNTNLNAKEQNSAYSYFEANNECSDSEWFVLQAETIEQCTGLEDKHGNLIYEGDVITVDSSTININDTQAIVFWDEYEASFNLQWLPQGNGANALKRIKKLCKHGVGDTRWWEVEVVGNVHENPELLEANNGK